MSSIESEVECLITSFKSGNGNIFINEDQDVTETSKNTGKTKVLNTDVYSKQGFFLYVLIMSHTRFLSESTLYSSLNVKELVARNTRKILSLSDSSGSRTHNHLVRKRTLNHLTKLASLPKYFSVRLQAKWLWVRVPLQSLRAFCI